MSTKQVTKLLDLVDGLFGKRKFSAEVVVHENGEQIKCNHGISNQEEIAQINLEKWNNYVNPFPSGTIDPSEGAVNKCMFRSCAILFYHAQHPSHSAFPPETGVQKHFWNTRMVQRYI